MPELIKEWSGFMYQRIFNSDTFSWFYVKIFIIVEVK